MTWKDWIFSSYSNNNFKLVEISSSYYIYSDNKVLYNTSGAKISASSTISPLIFKLKEEVLEEPLISLFVVDGVEYQYEIGMTWNTWLSSDYNTAGYCLRSDTTGTHVGITGDTQVRLYLNDNIVMTDDKIQSLGYFFE